jgi:hypothetical protein
MAKQRVQWQGLRPNPSKFFGFIYRITHKVSGIKYVGKKQFWTVAPKRTRKRPIADLTSDQFNWDHWKESDWETYTGSSDKLNKLIKADGHEAFDFHIVKQVSCKGDLTYSETEMLVKLDTLTERDARGERSYLNGNISAIRFIPPNKESEEL